jgi:hypothetical protein
MNRLKEGKELSLYERASIYQMHTAVWLFGWCISPEAAYEAFLLHFPHKKPVERYGDMWALNNYSTIVPYKGKDYANMGIKELRAALAINSKNTIIEHTDDYSLCFVRVEYTDAVNQIWKIPMHTSLFKYLQDKGILHPYTIMYFYMYT